TSGFSSADEAKAATPGPIPRRHARVVVTNPRLRSNPSPPANRGARPTAPLPDTSEPGAAPEPRAMSFPAPYDRYEGEVLPEWIDYNGHMTLAYSTVLFDSATTHLFDDLGLVLDYRRSTQQGTFVAET